MNENYLHPERPKNLKDSEIMQTYLFKSDKANIRILASGLTLRFAIDASKKLLEFGVKSNIWSITSFNELARGGIISDHENSTNRTLNHMLRTVLNEMPTIAVSEYQKLC